MFYFIVRNFILYKINCFSLEFVSADEGQEKKKFLSEIVAMGREFLVRQIFQCIAMLQIQFASVANSIPLWVSSNYQTSTFLLIILCLNLFYSRTLTFSKKLSDFIQRKPFKNDKKGFLFQLKNSFRSLHI